MNGFLTRVLSSVDLRTDINPLVFYDYTVRDGTLEVQEEV